MNIYNNKNKKTKDQLNIFACVLVWIMAGAVTQSVVAGGGGSVSYISPAPPGHRTLETGTRKTFQQPLDCV